MKSDDVDSFTELFTDFPRQRRSVREERAKKERRAQMSDRQRDRSAVRTEQINFRCAPEFKADIASLQVFLQKKRGGSRKPSIADVLEEALAMFAEREGCGL